MDTWLQFVKKQPEQDLLVSKTLLAELFTLDCTNPQVASIQSSVQHLSEQQISNAVEEAQLLDDNWPGFVALSKAYLIWCAFINPSAPETCFHQYAGVYLALQQAYANNRGACLNLVVRNITREIFRFFAKSGKDQLEWVASGLLKLFNAVRGERELPPKNMPSKRENAVFYANMISRAYFKSEQFVSAGNVFNNMHSLGISLKNFPASEQVEYRFWLGRYYLYCEDINLAFMHLNWAFEHCLWGTTQALLILDWLIVPSILVGRPPKVSTLSQLLNSHDLLTAVHELNLTLRKGAFTSNYHQAVLENPWIAARHLRPILLKLMPILTCRRGIKLLIQLSGMEKPNLQLVQRAVGLNLELDPDFLEAESICETLISQGMLKGNVLSISQTLVVKSQGSVPPLLEVNQVLTRPLSHREHWME